MRLQYKFRTSRDGIRPRSSILDALWGAAAPLLAFLLRDFSAFAEHAIQGTLLYAVLAAGFTALAFAWFGLSRSVAQFFSTIDALNIVKASFAAVLLTVLVCFLISRLDTIPRSVPPIHFLLLVAGSSIARAHRRMSVLRRNRVTRLARPPENVLIVGISELSFLYIQIAKKLSLGGRQVVAFLDNRRSMQGRFVHGFPVAGRTTEIEQVLDEYRLHGVPIGTIIVSCAADALSPSESETLGRVSAHRGIPVEYLPTILGPHIAAEPRDDLIDIDGSAMQELGNPRYWASKRVFDFLVALLALVLGAPIAAVAALLVVADCGMPFLFWQVRVGRYGQRITVFKFRTLRPPFDMSGQPIPEERRTSVIGHVLRLTHIDELPQLFSIVAGEMSLIGPRPLLPADLPERAGLRLAVRPGLTGWSQVNGATLLTVEEKNALDEWYVRHASWATDLRIIALTFRLLFTGVQRNETAIQEALSEQRGRQRSGL